MMWICVLCLQTTLCTKRSSFWRWCEKKKTNCIIRYIVRDKTKINKRKQRKVKRNSKDCVTLLFTYPNKTYLEYSEGRINGTSVAIWCKMKEYVQVTRCFELWLWINIMIDHLEVDSINFPELVGDQFSEVHDRWSGSPRLENLNLWILQDWRWCAWVLWTD